jgi:membrane-bound serine protease (ClpP class)
MLMPGKLVRRWIAAGCLALLASAAQASTGLAGAGAVHVARLQGIVDPITAQYLTRAVDRAEQEGAALLVVLVDTPGGLDSSTQAITQRLLAARVPVVAYVTPSGARAASAGMFVTLAAHIAVMTPGTSLGAEHLVGSRIGPFEPVMAGNATNDAASTVRALASQRGRDADWLDRAAREGLSATSEEALASGTIDLVARDLDDLLGQLDGRAVSVDGDQLRIATRGAPRVAVGMTLTELILHALLNPNVAFLLLNLGLLGLVAEFFHPGTLVPALVGAIALLLALVGLGTLPVNGGALLLLLLAFALFIADAHVAGHGALSAAGLGAFALGGLLLFSPVDAMPWQPGPIGVSPGLVAAVAAVFASYFLVVVRAALRMRHEVSAVRGAPEAGAAAVAVTALDPRGVVRVEDEEWSATADSYHVAAGQPLEGVAREGLHLRVRRVAAAEEASVPARSTAPADPLTRREREIAMLIARGLTNRQISAELVIAETTADRHVSNILGKLGFGSRTQVAVWVAEQRLAPAPDVHTGSSPL